MYQRTSVGSGCARTVGGGVRPGRGDRGAVRAAVDARISRGFAAWIDGLPGPVAVTYEAGPTGFGLARFLTARGVECLVAAPSKLQRPAGDRVKTDARDARHLARLLHLGEIVAVTVPRWTQEAARDLVRAREDVRGDLMSARHRVSKLLLRQGIVYSGGQGVDRRRTTAGCVAQRFERPGLQLAYDTAYDTMLRPWIVATAWMRRSPRWPPTAPTPRW